MIGSTSWYERITQIISAPRSSLKMNWRSGVPLQRSDADDHGLAWSYYFVDPDGNHLEITTYDHEPVRAELGASV